MLALFSKIPAAQLKYSKFRPQQTLSNFLQYFEIYFNEIRKLEIASGERDLKNQKKIVTDVELT
jgi:Leucine-rich repeat (LRR) protein